ncbi:MAG: SDR family NAD(P)-dependent oxidoreductase, partial [Kiloniellales bacterium]|nr:SDR family NAD(P)-dependent oxidoreductase [Kiloniellales bacterium]
MKSGDVVLITGGSRGIGAATASLAAAEGYKVALNYRAGEDRAAEVVSGIRSKGGFAVAIQGDVAREADVERMFAELDEKVGPIVGLVNCAG